MGLAVTLPSCLYSEQIPTMNMLVILLAASVAITAGHLHGDLKCNIDDPMYTAMHKCKEVLKPPANFSETLMNCVDRFELKDKLIGDLPIGAPPARPGSPRPGRRGPSSSSPLPPTGPNPHMILCILGNYKNLEETEKTDFSTCLLEPENVLASDNTLDLVAFEESVRAHIAEAEDGPAKESISAAVELCLPRASADVEGISSFKRCLMTACMKDATESAFPELFTC